MATQPPAIAAGVEALGPYQGSAYTQESFIVRRPDGQMVQLSTLLYLLLESVDGKSTSTDIATRVSASFGRAVSAENVDYLLETKFAPLGLLAEHEAACADKADAILALRFRVVLLRAQGVQVVGRILRPLFLPAVIAVALGALAVFDGWLFTGAPLRQGLIQVAGQPVLILLILGLALVSALFHECGHAAACCYGGAKPGVIGMGIYVVWPAFYTNVTDSYRLSRAGRVRTDLGGVYFNALFALLLAGTYLGTGFKPLLWAILIVHIELLEQLLPTFRFDGYFILGDLAGVPDLFAVMLPVLRSLRPGRPADPQVLALKRSARVTITAWVLLTIPVLALEIAFFAFAGPGLFTATFRSVQRHLDEIVSQFSSWHVVPGILTVLSLLLLLLPIFGVIFVLQMTLRRLWGSLQVALRRRGRTLKSIAVPLAISAVIGLGLFAGFAFWATGRAQRPATTKQDTVTTEPTAPGRGTPAAKPASPAAHSAAVPSHRRVTGAAVTHRAVTKQPRVLPLRPAPPASHAPAGKARKHSATHKPVHASPKPATSHTPPTAHRPAAPTTRPIGSPTTGPTLPPAAKPSTPAGKTPAPAGPTPSPPATATKTPAPPSNGPTVAPSAAEPTPAPSSTGPVSSQSPASPTSAPAAPSASSSATS